MPIRTDSSWSRLIRFSHPDSSAGYFYGEPVDLDADIGTELSSGNRVEVTLWDMRNPWDPKARKTNERVEVSKAQLLSPVSVAECGTIRAIGLNYKDHAKELGFPIPSEPVAFFKPSQTLAGPLDDIMIPSVCQSGGMDYEVELAIVIGSTCRDVLSEEAMKHVLGYSCANDLTDRTWQKSQGQWCRGKGFDKFCPLGPCIVSSKSFLHPEDITLETHVNGEVMQQGEGSNTIFSIGEIVSFLSQGSTLPAGTVILTGTPPGIAASKSIHLKHGDTVQCTISHGIGSLVNTIKYQLHGSVDTASSEED